MRATVVALLILALLTGAALYTGVMAATYERFDSRVVFHLTLDAAPLHKAMTRIEPSTEDTDPGLVTGLVLAYEGGRSLTLEASDQRELTVRIDATTQFAGARLAGLQVGDRVTVAYETVGDERTATSITIE